MPNSTLEDDCEWEDHLFIPHVPLVILTSFGIAIGMFSAIGNGLVLLTIFKKFPTRSSHIYFIASLSLADCLVGVLTMPFYAAGSLTWPLLLHIDSFEMFLDFLIFQSLGASTFNLLAVSYDRYVAITAPLHYTNVITINHVKCYIGLVWLASSLLGAGSFMVTEYHSRPSIYLVSILIAFVVPFCIIAYFYAKIFVIAKRQSRQIAQSNEVSVSAQSSEIVEERKRVIRDRKAAVTVAIVIGSFAICWSPNLIMGLVHFAVSTYSECESEKTEQIWFATLPFAFLNSAINPIIYTVRHETFRVGIKDILRSCWN